MTKLEAVKHLIRGQIDATIIDYEYDPAGSETSYEPSKADCEALAVLIPGFDPEKDLGFMTGGPRNAYYYLGPGVKDRLAIDPNDCARLMKILVLRYSEIFPNYAYTGVESAIDLMVAEIKTLRMELRDALRVADRGAIDAD